MANVLSGWTAGRYVNLVVRGAGDDGVAIKRVPAKWSFFATGLDDEDRYVLGRDRRVSGVALAGEYTRVDCVNRWGRDDVLHALERASLASDARDIQLLEADVAPLCRLLSDVGSLDVDPRPRLGYFDLEVDSRRSFDDMRKGAAHILSWAVVDGAGAVVGAAVLRDTSKASERALLRGFFDAVKDLDCLLAWNGESFDFEVLRNRAGVLGVEPPIDWMRWTWLDHMLVFKKYNMHSDDSGVAKVSYALNHVAEYLLGEGKVDFDASRTWEAWEAGGKSRQQLLDYNVHDVVLMQRVEEKTGYLSLHLAVCHICRVFPDTSSLNATRQGDGFLLRLGAERGYRWPTKVHVEETKRFAGAYVMEPRRLGAVDSVHVADFAGLYPSIMRTFNMGLDTKLDGPSEGACKLPGRDTYFRQDRDGMFRVALDRLVGKRAEYQRAMKECAPGTAEHEQFNRLSKAFKIVANSFYGICGSPYSRFFDVEIAEGVTQTGKWLLQQVIAAAESDGFDPFYGDSITGDRPVVLRDPRGDVVIRKVEDVWAMFGPASRAPGGKRTKRPPAGWMALARASDGREGWFPLRRVISHRVSKDVWRISTKDGQTEVTADHSIMVGGREVKPEQFVSEGMEFDIVGAVRGARRDTIDILDYVGRFELRSPYKGREIVRRFVVDPNDADWIMLDGWGNPTERVRRFYVDGSLEFDALLRACAAYASDGSASLRGITTSRYMLSFCKQDRAVLDDLHGQLNLICADVEWFGPYWSGGSNVYVMRSGTATMSAFFAALCGFKSKQKCLPDFVFGLSDDSLSVVWGQLLRGDGFAHQKQVGYVSTSPVLMAQVSYLFGLFGWKASISYIDAKDGWSIRTRSRGAIEALRLKHSVRRFENEAVYDLEVDGAHTFVDGIGRVLVSNTDSVFVAGDGDRFRRFVIAMNSSWASRLREHGVTGEHHIDLDFEKTFRRLIMVSAKRYAGAFAMYKGQDASATKPEVKGLEFKRGDTLSLAREFQTEVVLALLESELPAVDRMWAMVARWRERVLRGELQPADVTLSQSLSRPVSEYSADYTRPDCARCGERFPDGRDASGPDKCGCGELRKRREYPAHVRVAVEMARRGKPIQEGGRVSYMIVEGDGTNMVPVAADEPGAFERIDREYYWQRRVFPPSRRLLEIVYPDVEWGETRQDKAARVAERSRGQRTLFDVQDPPRKRRRRQIQIAFDAVAPGRDGATDGDRVRLQAVRAAIEAHPGDVPVVLVYRWDDCGKGVEVRLPVGLSIRNDAAALRAIERVIGDGKVIGARTV